MEGKELWKKQRFTKRPQRVLFYVIQKLTRQFNEFLVRDLGPDYKQVG